MLSLTLRTLLTRCAAVSTIIMLDEALLAITSQRSSGLNPIRPDWSRKPAGDTSMAPAISPVVRSMFSSVSERLKAT